MSKVLIKRSVVLGAWLMCAASGRAYAQQVVDVKVPFAFRVSDQTFKPGMYEVTMNAAGSGVVSLRGDHGKAFAFALTIPADGHDPAGEQPALVFSRYENTYRLSQIWETGSEGREVTR